jgi:rubrerythrin
MFVGAITAQVSPSTSTAGTEFMDAAHQAMILVLKSIRDQADSILKKIERTAEQRSLAWKCTSCGYAKRFTRPVFAEVAAPCPKCDGETFQCV